MPKSEDDRWPLRVLGRDHSGRHLIDCPQVVILACVIACLMGGLCQFYGIPATRPDVLLLPTQRYPIMHVFPHLLFPVGNEIHSVLFTTESIQHTQQLTALGRNYDNLYDLKDFSSLQGKFIFCFGLQPFSLTRTASKLRYLGSKHTSCEEKS